MVESRDGLQRVTSPFSGVVAFRCRSGGPGRNWRRPQARRGTDLPVPRRLSGSPGVTRVAPDGMQLCTHAAPRSGQAAIAI